MDSPEQIAGHEVILKRIPPWPEHIMSVGDRGQRATSLALEPKRGEASSSWTRLCRTSPRRLLDLLHSQDIASAGWRVWWLRVGDAQGLGLHVVEAPTPDDPGHCEIRRPASVASKVWSRLARLTLGRILTDDQVQVLHAGDSL